MGIPLYEVARGQTEQGQGSRRTGRACPSGCRVACARLTVQAAQVHAPRDYGRARSLTDAPAVKPAAV